MSKKMMKRSLALGALMAFVITGSAMAEEPVYSEYTGTGTESHVSNVYWDGNGGSLTLSKDTNATAIGKQHGSMGLKNFSEIIFDGQYYTSGFLANPGNITLDNIGTIKQTEGSYVTILFSPQYGGNIVANVKDIIMNDCGNAIYCQSGSTLTINASGDVELGDQYYDATLVGACNLSVDRVNVQNTATINAENVRLTAPLGTALKVESYKWTTGEPPYDSLTGKNLLDINVRNNLEVNARVAVEAKNGTLPGNAVIDIDADNEVKLTAVERGINARDYGTVNIDAAKTTITTNNSNGLSYGIDARNGSSVNVNGDLVIDATSTDDYAAGIYSVYDGDVTLGSAENKSDVSIKATCVDKNENQDAGWDNAYGVYAYSHTTKGNNGEVNIFADDLNITVDGAYAYGVFSGSNVDTGEGKSSVVIDANRTQITATSDIGKAAALTAYSGSELVIKGDLVASGDYVLQTRGGATVKINESAKNTVNLTGDICFAEPGSVIDADVLVNLSDEKSTFKGSIYSSNADRTNEIKGMTLGISNGATWDVTGDSFVNNLTLSDGNIKHNVGDVTVNKISGSGNIVFAEDSGHLHIDAGTASLNLTMAEKTADDLNTAKQLTTVAEKLGVKEEAIKDISAKVIMAEGDIKGETTGVVTFVAPAEDEKKDDVVEAVTEVTANNASSATTEGDVNNVDNYWHGEVTEVTEKVNTKNQAIGDAGISLKLHWRAHVNDMNKRMGELRNADGEHGVWARMVRGESEYKNTKAQYNQYQLGYDEKLSVDERWTVGAAVTFAEGDANYGQGTTDDKSTAFAIYGSKLNNDGTFVDLIARYAHLESDLDDVNSGKGDYATNGMSVSAEFGKRIQQGNGLWIEPQVELTYGTIDSAEFQLGQKTVTVGDMDSLIGRVGFRIGKDLKQGNVYARASYLYDFEGETENAFSNGTDSRTIAEDLGGGWWEVGVGANINLSKATYIYADIEKTFGGEVDTKWQWNLGVRYSF